MLNFVGNSEFYLNKFKKILARVHPWQHILEGQNENCGKINIEKKKYFSDAAFIVIGYFCFRIFFCLLLLHSAVSIISPVYALAMM